MMSHQIRVYSDEPPREGDPFDVFTPAEMFRHWWQPIVVRVCESVEPGTMLMVTPGDPVKGFDPEKNAVVIRGIGVNPD